MKANLKNRTIEMTKNEAKAAGRINSEKYIELRDYQNAYPTFTISIVEKRSKKSQYTGLDYKFMGNYISNSSRDDKDEIMNEFNVLRGVSNIEGDESEKLEKASYLEVREWFLAKFPEIKKYKDEQKKKIKKILAA